MVAHKSKSIYKAVTLRTQFFPHIRKNFTQQISLILNTVSGLKNYETLLCSKLSSVNGDHLKTASDLAVRWLLKYMQHTKKHM